jgi:hypothetical protein
MTEWVRHRFAGWAGRDHFGCYSFPGILRFATPLVR